MKQKNLQAIIFGPQGSGKGTQGLLLAERFNVPLIGAGDLFRAEMSQQSTLGNLVSQYVTQGLLAPDDLVDAVVARQLKKVDLSKGYILDGYPRNVEQAMHLDKLVKIKLAVQIKISDDEAVIRLSGRKQCVKCKTIYHDKYAQPAKKGFCSLCGEPIVQRADDTEKVIMQRLKAYHLLTAPMASYYRQKGILLTVNGEQPIQYVFEDIINKIAKLGFLP
ncbi:MAG: nucleoside monophosphate kinase [Patescibacteria group bacterium]|nr:nucleoside monophosphate kinase [Patescibacteria group bacterium]